jgi:hypothetical protein
MDPVKTVESLKEFVATMETLMELAPDATPQQLVEYANGVIASPVAASVLCMAISGLTPAEVKPAPKRTFAAVR